MTLSVLAVGPDRLADLDALFGTNKTTAGCRCMWFILRAKDCSAGWGAGNRAALASLASSAPEPIGLLAYRDDEPVGWCAAGPRSRYTRALGIPTLKQRDPAEDDDVWLVSCFFVRTDARRSGVTVALLEGAVELARSFGATAVEGFPLSGDGRRSAGDAFVGVEPLFDRCGFAPIRRPTDKRVIMRRDL